MHLKAIETFYTSEKKNSMLVAMNEPTKEGEAEKIIVIMRFLRICTIGSIGIERKSNMFSTIPGWQRKG